MTKKLEFDWHIKVPEKLLNGCEFDKWTEEGGLEANCLFKVDEYGFFIFWKSEGKDGDVIELCQVSDIRKGGLTKDSKLLMQMQAKYEENNFEERVLTICSGTDYVNINYLHVVCPDNETAEDWQNGLRKITHNNKMNNVCVWTNLMKHWMRLKMMTDAQGNVPVRVIARTFASGRRDKSEVCKYLEQLNLPSGKGGKNDIIEPEKFTFEKFYTLYHKICPRTEDIGELFNMITNQEAESISVSQFVRFLNEKQRDPRLNEVLYPMYDETRALQIIQTYEQDETATVEKKLTKDGFTRYLMSDENAPVFLDRLDLYMDMDQPLAHYYINSSHNTYLTGRQFYGKSSVEMYRQVLLAGCRCVELDCWDGGGEDEEPIITHGKAMCTAIPLKDVIYAIRDTAFETSEYPVILSLENHCNKAQQYKLAKYCVDIFGDLLLTQPLPQYPLLPDVPLPSPNALKNKILIKNKRLDPEKEIKEMEEYLSGNLKIDDGEKEDSAAPTITSLDKKRKIYMMSKRWEKRSDQEDLDVCLKGEVVIEDGEKDAICVTESTSLDKKVPDGIEGVPIPTQYTGSTTNVHPWLSSMVNYAQPVKFQSFEFAEKNRLHFNMSSFAETNGLSYLKSQSVEFVQYNKRQMSRIYPRGTRFDSTNFLPQVFWNAGCQMVALNFQTPDLAMQLNQGKFEYNGNCGYLLKPDFMRRHDKVFDPFAETTVDGVIAAQCSVQVISGQFLSDKKVGTYVEVDMYGLPTDTIRKEFRTHLVPSNGLNPYYNEKPFIFRKVVLPDLAVLRFGVFDETGKLLGQRILPLDGLQTGYRHISLRTEANFPMSLPMLFCNIQLKIYVPNGLEDIINALTDPRAYYSAHQKRQKMMQNMGIEDADEDEKQSRADSKDDRTVSSTTAKKGSKSGQKDEVSVSTSGSKEGIKLGSRSSSALVSGACAFLERENGDREVISLDSLQQEKSFQKVLRKHQKELDALLRKQNKELFSELKAQCLAIERAAKGKGREEVSSDPVIRDLVANQIKQWTGMKERQRGEVGKMNMEQVLRQQEVLEGLLDAAITAKLKQQEVEHEREVKILKQKQAKISVETSREVNNDKALKSKTERDRCMREKKQSNIKKFVEDRRQLETHLQRRRVDLKAKLEKEKEKIKCEVMHLSQMYKNEEIEYELTPKKEFFA